MRGYTSIKSKTNPRDRNGLVGRALQVLDFLCPKAVQHLLTQYFLLFLPPKNNVKLHLRIQSFYPVHFQLSAFQFLLKAVADLLGADINQVRKRLCTLRTLFFLLDFLLSSWVGSEKNPFQRFRRRYLPTCPCRTSQVKNKPDSNLIRTGLKLD